MAIVVFGSINMDLVARAAFARTRRNVNGRDLPHASQGEGGESGRRLCVNATQFTAT